MEMQRGTWKLYGNGVKLRIYVEIIWKFYGIFMEVGNNMEIAWK